MFRLIDLHIHTPTSDCYADHMNPEARIHTSPQDIVAAALAAGLEAIAITDHNTAEGIEPVREAGQSKGLAVFPGVEVSAPEGHVLGIFGKDTSVENIRQLVQRLGFQREQQGLGFAETTLPLETVLALIAEHGGLAIAAHVDRRPKGFVASTDVSTEAKARIYASPYLSALEITIPQNKGLWNRGEMPGYPRPIACLQGSDAHAPAEVGRRPVYVDIPEISLEWLRLALGEYRTRILFPQEPGVGLARQGHSQPGTPPL